MASPEAVAAPRPVNLFPLMGILAVITDCPSTAIDCVSAVAISEVVLFCTVLLIVVPVTTGFPAGSV